jgi:hypothetical protein
MWCPEGYVSWNLVLNSLFETTEKVLSQVCMTTSAVKEHHEKTTLTNAHTTEFYLIGAGYAENYDEARLIVCITVAFLLVNFMDKFPPVLAEIHGSKVHADETILGHRDNLEECYYKWPLKDDAQVSMFFEYARQGGFKSEGLLTRFAFIDVDTGEIRNKNGGKHYLINGIGLDDQEANATLSFVSRVSGFVVCWPAFPDDQEYRRFLDCITWDETILNAVNEVFGPTSRSSEADTTKKIGRPSMRSKVAALYNELFPQGHEASGKTWKDALRQVNSRLTRPISEDTLKRSVRIGLQNPQ